MLKRKIKNIWKIKKSFGSFLDLQNICFLFMFYFVSSLN